MKLIMAREVDELSNFSITFTPVDLYFLSFQHL